MAFDWGAPVRIRIGTGDPCANWTGTGDPRTNRGAPRKAGAWQTAAP